MEYSEALASMFIKLAPHDESVSSFILRMQLAADPTVVPVGVIGSCGRWVNAPFVNVEFEYIFESYPDHLLLELLDIDKSIGGVGNQLFDNPASYAVKISTTFFNGDMERKKTNKYHNVRYCISCIEESIKTVGYGYFKFFWNHSDQCLVHNKPLRQLPGIGLTNTLSAIRKILKAEDHESAIYVCEVATPPSIERKRYIEDFSNGFIFPIKFSPCVMSLFASWLNKNAHRLNEGDIRRLAYEISRDYLLRKDDRGLYHYKYLFSAIFVFCVSNMPSQLGLFYSEYIELIGLDFGPRYQGLLREIVAKGKNNDCKKCTNSDCVMHGKVKTFDVCSQDFSMQYIVENSYTLTRLVMQGKTIERIGNMPWSPIRV